MLSFPSPTRRFLAAIALLIGRAVWRRVEAAKPKEEAEASA